MRSRTENPGFTLLELLVALSLMAALTASLYVTFRIAFTGREHAEAALAPVRIAEQTMDLIRADLESATPPTGLLAGPFTGSNGTTPTGLESDTLSFYSCSNNPEDPHYPAGAPPAGDIRLVQYSLVTINPTDTTSTLQRQITTNLLAPDVETPVTDYLCQNVLSFTVQYFDGTSWWPTWDSTQQGNVLPNAVEITLQLQPPATPQSAANSGQNNARTPGQNTGQILGQANGQTGYQFTRLFLPPCSPAIAANQAQGSQGLPASTGSTGSSGSTGSATRSSSQ